MFNIARRIGFLGALSAGNIQIYRCRQQQFGETAIQVSHVEDSIAVESTDEETISQSTQQSERGGSLSLGAQQTQQSRPQAGLRTVIIAANEKMDMASMFTATPPQPHEIQGVIQTLRSTQDLTALLGEEFSQISHRANDVFWNAVTDSATNDFLNLLQQNVDSAKCKRPVVDAECSVSPWEILRKSYKCSICHDVLACPKVTPCGHSFCGHCIHALMDSCSSSDAEVLYSCPECRSTFESSQVTFEKILSEIISNEVERVHCFTRRDELAKIEWCQRRDDYLQSYHQTGNWKSGRQPLTGAQSASHNSGGSSHGHGSEHGFGTRSLLFERACIAVAFIVVALVAINRAQSK